MNRNRLPAMNLKSLVANGKDMISGKLAHFSTVTAKTTARFKGRMGSCIAVITSLIVGFLTMPNNIMYFIDHKHATRLSSDDDECVQRFAFIHAGIVLIITGFLAMVVAIVLSYFAAKSKLKVDATDVYRASKVRASTKTVYACLVMMNVELFMAVIAGCMEVLYRPLTSDEQRLHNVECAIAVFNVIIYIMYVVTMMLTATVLRDDDNRERDHFAESGDSGLESVQRDYVTRGQTLYNTHNNYVM